MPKLIFYVVAYVLSLIGRKTKLTYNQVNIIAYYFLVPFSWLILLDIIFQFHYLKIAFLIFTLGFIAGCINFREYSNLLFEKSVQFLKYFNKFGSTYIISSVVICVFLPIVIYSILIFLVIS